MSGIEVQRRPDEVAGGGEQPAAERAEQKRCEEQPAAEARAERDDRGRGLEQQDHADGGKRHADRGCDMQRAVTGRHHLRRGNGETADDQPADGWPQPGRDFQPHHELLPQRHAAHQQDAEGCRCHAEQARDDQVAHRDGVERAGDQPERHRREIVRHQVTVQRGDADRGEPGRGVAADDQLEGVERAGKRRAEGAGDRRGGAAADQEPQVVPSEMEHAADPGGHAAAELGVAGFEADRCADAARPDGLRRDNRDCRAPTSARRAAHWPRSGRPGSPAAIASPAWCRGRAPVRPRPAPMPAAARSTATADNRSPGASAKKC